MQICSGIAFALNDEILPFIDIHIVHLVAVKYF